MYLKRQVFCKHQAAEEGEGGCGREERGPGIGEEEPEADLEGTSSGRSPLGLWAKGFEVQTVRRSGPHEGRHGPEGKSRNTSEGPL